MTSTDVSRSYDQIAQHWIGPDFPAQNGLAQHRRALQFLQRRGTSLDVGCGSNGRILTLLSEEGFAAEALDISAEMIRLAKETHPTVVFHLADVVTVTLPKQYAFISAWDSIWHVPLAQQEGVLRKLCLALEPEGVLIFTLGGMDRPGEVHNPLHDQPMYHATLGVPKTLSILAEESCVCRHLEYDQWSETHLYIIVQKSTEGVIS